jgi:hypothetical protein
LIYGSSPCADAGNNSYNTYSYDIRGTGFSRNLNKTDGAAGLIDMGTYEYKLNTDPMPVELSYFSATTIGSAIKLNWSTATEVNNYGFEVERCELRAECQTWANIGFVNGNGNSNSPKDYSFVDSKVSTGNYSYRLKQIDNDGQSEYSETVEVSFMKPNEFSLEQNYPNPFNPSTIINYTLPVVSSVKVTIFNLLGESVYIFINGMQEPGYYELNWNAGKISSGIYFYRLEAKGIGTSYNDFVSTKKMLLMK